MEDSAADERSIRPTLDVREKLAAAEETMLGENLVAAQHPVRQQDVVGLVVPGVVREVALGDQPQVAVPLGPDPIRRGRPEPHSEEAGHGLPNLEDVVRVDIVKERRPNKFRLSKA